MKACSVDGARRELTRAFRQAGLATPELDARLLVGQALELDHAALVAAARRELTAAQADAITALAARRLACEPVARIAGKREFWGLDLRLNAETLVPRPESETVVEAALATIDRSDRQTVRVADLGTGSGALLLALHIAVPLVHATTNAPTANGPLRVVTTPIAPFVLPNTDPLAGFSVDVWNEVARRLHLDFTWQVVAVDDLLPAVERGVNEHELGKIVRFGIDHPAVKGINFQPAFHAGRHTAHDPMQRMTIPDILKLIEAQTAEKFKVTDFSGSCSNCSTSSRLATWSASPSMIGPSSPS